MNKYDLQERTTNLSKMALRLCGQLHPNLITRPLIGQLIRSVTSVGANYMEATGASSEKDFVYKLFLCKKEAQESEYWLDLLIEVYSDKTTELFALKQECHELVLIFSKASATTRNKMKIGN